MAKKIQEALTAEIIQETIFDRHGREYGLSVASRAYLVLGIVGAMGGVLTSIFFANLIWIAAGLLALFVGVTFHLVFGAQAEIIRLLKASRGELYSGVVSGNEKSTVYICSECGASNYSDVPVCRKCKAVFEKKDSAPEGAQGQGS
jgi:hypothetical protein